MYICRFITALSSNPTDWRCSSAGSELGCADVFSGVWIRIPVGEFFFYFLFFVFCKNEATGCRDIAYCLLGYFILSHPVVIASPVN